MNAEEMKAVIRHIHNVLRDASTPGRELAGTIEKFYCQTLRQYENELRETEALKTNLNSLRAQ